MVRAVFARPFSITILFALFLAASSPAHGQTIYDSCTTPRQAAQTFLANLQDDEHLERAVRCFDWNGVRSDERETLVRKLKAVLDQRGFFIDMDAIPDTLVVEDEDGRIELTRELPQIYLTEENDLWRISSASVQEIDGLYDEVFDVDVESLVESLPDWMRGHALPGVTIWQLLGLLLSLLIGLILRAVVTKVVVGQGVRLLRRTGLTADDAMLTRTAHPIGTLAFVAMMWWALPLLRFGVRVNQIGMIGLRVLAASAVVLIVYRFVDVAADVFARRAAKTDTKLDDQVVPLIRKTLKVFVAVVGIIFVLQNLNVDVGSLLAGVSLGGLAFTLAAKDTVANLFGSVSIFADQPFQVGDWVVIDKTEGVVEEVGMRSTRIRTFYDSVVSIPNSIVANTAVDNYGQRRHRRCVVTLGLTYDASREQLRAFVMGIRAILEAHESVREGNEVHFRNFGESGLEVFVYFFLTVPDWTAELTARQEVFLEIMRLAKVIGVEFAFPTQTLHLLRDDAAPAPMSEQKLLEAARAFGPGDTSHTTGADFAGGFGGSAPEPKND